MVRRLAHLSRAHNDCLQLKMAYTDSMFHAHNTERLSAILRGIPTVVTGYHAMQLSGDMAAPFLQESTFWWLTGIDEPGWRVIIEPARHHVTLVAPAISEIERIFNGGMSSDDAMKRSNANEVIESKDFEKYLRQLARTHTVVNTLEVDDEPFVSNPAKRELNAILNRTFSSVVTIDKDVASLRAIKSDEEIRRIRQACNETVEAFKQVRAQWANYKYEYQVESDFTAAFRSRAATHAYAPIVAAGERACTLHYDKNMHAVRARDLVVIDIGARVNGYAADVTRTYAMNPSKRQRAVHAAVQEAQKQIIALLKPELSVIDYTHAVDEIMKDALESLGLLARRDDDATYRKYFPHAVGHGLGVDVHDRLGAPRYFESGMVLTVEPGIYIPEEGIGVRIEDDILITSDGHENLTRKLSTDL